MENKVRLLSLNLVFLCFLSVGAGQGPANSEFAEWTWPYHFLLRDKIAGVAESSVVVSKKHTPAFTQLIFSWNATRPRHGYFKFFGQVCDEKTGQWYDWHHMVSWGNSIRETYLSGKEPGSSYHYVRLELPKDRKGNAFKIRIEACDGASLHDVVLLSACVSDLSLKKTLKDLNNFSSLSSVYIEDVPSLSQMELDHVGAARMCSPTSTAMLAGFCSGKMVDPLDVARNCYDTGLQGYGSWPLNVAYAYELCGEACFFSVERLPSFAALHNYLKQGSPVVVSIRGPLRSMPHGLTYQQGHLLVVVGFDHKRQEVICHDPAFPHHKYVEHAYDINDFYTAWKKSNCLVYVRKPTPLFFEKSQHSDSLPIL